MDTSELTTRYKKGERDFKKANLRGADLWRANLLGANLQGADLQGANLQGADLQEADLQGADLREADLRGTDLEEADLQEADLRGANLRGANLWRANLRRANLWRADLRGANLRGANLWRANLRGANLRGADLRGANLWRANLRRTYLPAPTMMLLANWCEVSDDLCIDLMRYDAECHDCSTDFDKWKKNGECPYDGKKFERAANFKEKKELWIPGPPPRIFDLMTRVIVEQCANSDWHEMENQQHGD